MLPSGLPSHDTFNRVFAVQGPEKLERGLGGLGALDGEADLVSDNRFRPPIPMPASEHGKGAIAHRLSCTRLRRSEGRGPRSGPAQGGRKVQRDHVHSQAARGLGLERNGGHAGRHGLAGELSRTEILAKQANSVLG
jgi:hypothetical protein